MSWKYVRMTMVLGVLLTACSQGSERKVDLPVTTPATPSVATTRKGVPQATKIAKMEPTETAVASETPIPSPEPTGTLLPTPTEVVEQIELFSGLENVSPPDKDDIALARDYGGVTVVATRAATESARQVGEVDSFLVSNIQENTVGEIDAKLLAKGEYGYFWFEEDSELPPVDPSRLAAVVEDFDEIFRQVNGFFGDGNPADESPVHILHVSPMTMCGVSIENAGLCTFAGFFSDSDLLPRSVNVNSNEREMFVMNALIFSRGSYESVLAHELRHMIETRFDKNDEDWAVEGSATLASDLLGYKSSGQTRANLFLAQPDRQLNRWSEEDRLPHYGQGYLLSRYIFDRLGPDLYRDFALSEKDGLAALDTIAMINDLNLTGLGMWLDWLATLALVSNSDAPEPYHWLGPEIDKVATEVIDELPATRDEIVSQFAADYYSLPPGQELTIQFQGAPTVPLLLQPAFSGERIWYALRANNAHARLMRNVDLTGVDRATLKYAVYTDIEEGYDFAYVGVSTDNGQTWRPLISEGMQGQDVADDPSDSALAKRFYSSRSANWTQESIDLTPYAGQNIQLRFDMVTDPILTYGGFALDDIEIPEIGFFDDVETTIPGWTAEGFVPTTDTIPQRWHLTTIIHDGSGPQVETMAVIGGNGLVVEIDASDGKERPIVIIAASSPQTLQPAQYQLEISGP